MSCPEDAIVDAALQLPAAERAAYLDKACADDHQLRQLVEALLRAHQRATVPREAPTSPASQKTIALSPSPTEKPGDRIGRYKLLQQVGEGGYGVVYMAEQEEPVRRRVALKVIKLGMDTKQVIARFEAERQALALMDHPNIAKVLDAGATETGRPYFVMELVRGIKITEYCDQNNLPTAKRLDLFIQVCHAIQHAHQKGIIHRDIKPSNILVTLHDGVPVPKVIDFGIAKATEQRLTDKTLFTALEQVIGTPAYMSPEQAEMSGLDIDTRSDIYSLGVLLYELLTSKVPFEAKELAAASLDEMRRVIREKEPTKPSTRLSDLGKAEQSTIAKLRQLEAPRLIHLVRRDLDWIVMKCLEKDRSRRYETAVGVARDILRYLHDEPVLARPPGTAYRLRKLVRRHRLAVAAGIAVATALMLGLVVSSWQAVRATLAEKEQRRLRAETEEAREGERNKLWESYLALARAGRWSGRAGRRFESLDALRKAAAIRPSLELRNEAIACMALADLHVAKEWDAWPESVAAFGFDPPYERYTTGDQLGNVIIRRVADDLELMRLPRVEASISRVDFSPDGRLLFVGFGKTNRFQIWNLATKEITLDQSTLDQSDTFAQVFSTDSHLLAFYRAKQKEIIIYNLAYGKTITSLQQTVRPWAIQFHPDGSKLAVSHAEGKVVEVQDIYTGKLLRSFSHPENVTGLAWHPDGNMLGIASDKDIYLWNSTATNAPLILAGHTSLASGLCFSHSGDLLASISWDNTLRLWDPLSGRQLLSIPASFLLWPSFSTDGRWLAFKGPKDKVGLWEVATGRECRQLRSSFVNARMAANHFVFHPNGRLLLSAHSGAGVRIWDLATARELHFLPEPYCANVFLAADGRHLITIGGAGMKQWPFEAVLKDAKTRIRIGPAKPVGPETEPRAVCQNLNRQMLAFSQQDKLRLLDATTLQETMQLPGTGWYWFGALSADAKLYAAGIREENKVRVWETERGTLVKELSMHLPRLAFSPDGKWLVAGSAEEYQFLDTQTWKSVRCIPRGRTANAGVIAFTPDGRSLAVTDSADSVRLLDAATCRELASFESPDQQGIAHLDFSPDGGQLAVASATGAIQLWNLSLIRQQLAVMKLDWDAPHPPASAPSDLAAPLTE